jgi:hypothetical protein
MHFERGDTLTVEPLDGVSFPEGAWVTHRREVTALDRGVSDGAELYDVSAAGERRSVYGYQIVRAKRSRTHGAAHAETPVLGWRPKTRKIAGRAITLIPGWRYAVSRPLASIGRLDYPVHIEAIGNETPPMFRGRVLTLTGFDYDGANFFMGKFLEAGHGRKAFGSIVW